MTALDERMITSPQRTDRAPKQGNELPWPQALAITVTLAAVGLVASGWVDPMLP
ncbi:hypothetical protein [Actinocrispum wychmicini]|uniref:Uncharacterized protein n=1 Tax=Actinocrispum wychmicini TaxID=1213861 RepID=A0A4R2IJN1_9PSEU|nr:hypothetical protein [Actinocrispum wychmicini]TCO45281.1 hypothetical protein EV192_12145 [Actinocrispum wychmicini]